MSFDDLSRRTGIEIPPLLAQLLAGGPPELASFSDFEWIDAAEAAGTIDEWLDAKWQDGRRFLPFAQSGAGDAYCLMPLDGTGTGTGGGDTVGVAFVWHDAEESRIEHASFSDFVCAKFLQTFADMELARGVRPVGRRDGRTRRGRRGRRHGPSWTQAPRPGCRP
jgi:hypothetical protein